MCGQQRNCMTINIPFKWLTQSQINKNKIAYCQPVNGQFSGQRVFLYNKFMNHCIAMCGFIREFYYLYFIIESVVVQKINF
jgi:hypothetical protein